MSVPSGTLLVMRLARSEVFLIRSKTAMDQPTSLIKQPFFRIGLGLLCVLMGYFVFDMSGFVWCCRGQAERARLGSQRDLPPVSPKEAIVVLTGDQNRIAKALELLRERQSPLLIISGTGRGATLTDLVNAQGTSAVNIHEIWEKIILESQSASTIENAEESARILFQKGIERVILVTSDYHLCRALSIFRLVTPGIEYIAYPVASRLSEVGFPLSTHAADALWKLWVEYWKHFLFTHYLIHHVGPFQK